MTTGPLRTATRRKAAMAVCLAVGLLAGMHSPNAASAGDATPLLPDLRMARLSDIGVQVAGDMRQLRFDATVVNVGAGPLEVLGSRASTSDPMAVFQRIHDSAGGTTDLTTTATMFFAGDGHTHWHLHDFEAYVLRRAGAQLGRAFKSGYCMFDNVRFRPELPGAPVIAAYNWLSVCGRDQPDALSVSSGISVGWGDRYASTLPDQYVDITALRPGIYRLVAIADYESEFTESEETNNRTWVRLYIHAKRVEILKFGPAARPQQQ